jgi:hypothetical protein
LNSKTWKLCRPKFIFDGHFSSRESKQTCLIFGRQGIPALHDDKHVIDADAEEQERQNVVHGPEEEADGRAEAVGDDDAEDDAGDAGDRQVDALESILSNHFGQNFRIKLLNGPM